MTEQELREAVADEICQKCPMQVACLHSYSSLCDIDETSGKILALIKSACYLKAKRELPEVEEDCPFARLDEQAKMLKEVDGVSFKACKEFKS